jgi:hypothetical protein
MNKSELESRIKLAKQQLKTARKLRLPYYHIASIKGYLATFEAQLEKVGA